MPQNGVCEYSARTLASFAGTNLRMLGIFYFQAGIHSPFSLVRFLRRGSELFIFARDDSSTGHLVA